MKPPRNRQLGFKSVNLFNRGPFLGLGGQRFDIHVFIMNRDGVQKRELISTLKVGVAGVIHTVSPERDEMLLSALVAFVLEPLETIMWSLRRS